MKVLFLQQQQLRAFLGRMLLISAVTWWDVLTENCPSLQKRELEKGGKRSQSEGLLGPSAKVRSLAVLRRPGWRCVGFLYYSLTPEY